MADPLSLVRDFNVDKKLDKIRTTGDNVDFDGMYMFPKSSFTAFRGAKDYCTLEVVLYVLNTRALQQPDYLKQAAAAKLETLSFIERKKLLDILDGKTNLQLEAVPGAKTAEDLGDDNEPAAKRAKLADDMPAVQVQERFHRQLRDRNTMLLAPQKDFKLVFDIASRAHMQLSTMFKQRQQEEHQQAKAADAKQQRHDKHAQAPPPKASAPGGTKPSGRFDRDTTTDALKAFGGEAAAGINSVIAMYGSHADTGGQEGPTNGAAAHAPPPAPASQSSRGKDAHHQQQQRHSSHKHASSSQPQPSSKPAPGSRHAPAAPPAAPADPLAGAVPIIIVPSGMTAMINMFNAAEFLESGQFKPSVEAAALAKGVKSPSVTIRRTMGKPPGKSVPYLITDKPNDKKDHLWWGRVVAVIAQGAKWQFKDFPFKGADKGDMVETFQKMAGFYVHWANEAVPDMVANWNVKPLGLARDKRHMDTPVVLELYRHIDAFLSNRKSPLAY